MLFLKILAAIFLIYLLLLFFLPKGNPVQEIVYLLYWWAKIYTIGFSRKAPEHTKHAYGKHRQQYLIFWKPLPDSLEKKHVILYFHGGGWQFGRPEGFRLHAQQFSKEGYYSFFPCHRKVPKYGYPAMREDISLMLVKVQELMRKMDLAEKKIILGGISSGGNLGALLFLNIAALNALGLSQNLFGALFLAAAPLDLNKMPPTPNLHFFAGKRNSKTFQAANPINYLNNPLPIPLLCLTGSHDGLVPAKVSASFVEKAKALNSPDVTYKIMEKGGHLDSASWCFENHQSWTIIKEWLLFLENR